MRIQVLWDISLMANLWHGCKKCHGQPLWRAADLGGDREPSGRYRRKQKVERQISQGVGIWVTLKEGIRLICGIPAKIVGHLLWSKTWTKKNGILTQQILILQTKGLSSIRWLIFISSPIYINIGMTWPYWRKARGEKDIPLHLYCI